MILSILKNQKGVALISVYLASVFITTISGAAYGKSFWEMRQVEREIARLQSYAAAEAGIQNAMAVRIGAQAFTGFINVNDLDVPTFQNYDGSVTVGNYSVTMTNPNNADWVIITSTATANGETKTLEGRVFLDSNLSKYLVYATPTTFYSGTNAQYGEPDYTDTYGDGDPDYPELVPANEDDRMMMYFKNNWQTSGSNVQVYGDVHAENQITGNNTSQVHGDTYVGNFWTNGSGVQNSGVSGGLTVGDGFDDDSDRNGDSVIDSDDFPDYHDLTAEGADDSHKTEELDAIDLSFYATNNSVADFAGANSQTRYLQLESYSNNGSDATRVIEYTDSNYDNVNATYDLDSTAIVYVKGDMFVKGEVGGRVSFVSSDDIFFHDSVSYSDNAKKADVNHSTAFMATDKLYYLAPSIEVSGILVAQKSGSGSVGMNASYDQDLNYNPNSKTFLRTYGNRIFNNGATSNMGTYDDRAYVYDKNLKYFRPPGIPVFPDLRVVREADNPATA